MKYRKANGELKSVVEQLTESIANRCRHFNGTQHEKCKAGVEYRQFATPEGKLLHELPCFKSDGESHLCASHEFPTEETAIALAEESERKMMKGAVANAAAREDAKSKGFGVGNGGRGEIKCTACDGGTLHYSVAGVNGHLWGRCSTPGCVSWMQ